MSKSKLHEDLVEHLRHKLKQSIVDHVDIAKTMDIESSEILAGVGEILLTLTTSYCHTTLDMTASQFARHIFKLYKHFEEQEKAKAAKP